MKPLVSMRQALADPELLGNAIPGDSWSLWRTLLIAAMGEALTDDERQAFTAVTGRPQEPLERVDEFWNIVGRRGGKTRAAGTLGAYLAALCDWSDKLASGERGVLPIMAASTLQGTRAFNHVAGILKDSPILSTMMDGESTADTIRLTTRIDIEVRPANYRTIRGVTAVGAIADEVCIWMTDGSANPDAEILNALRPAMATTGGMLMVISTPYARRGELWETYRRDYGAAGDPLILVAKGPSRAFNPTLPQKVIDRALAKDPAAAGAEFLAEFRKDVEAFVDRDIVEACVADGVIERPWKAQTQYKGFIDPSGGSSDSMTMAIAHAEADKVVLDVVRERKPPFSPASVVAEFAKLFLSYGIRKISGDHYGGEWPREAFSDHGITYEPADKSRSELYVDLLPLLNSGRADLLDDDKLVDQLVGLERRASRGGRERIDHGPSGHDDVANAVAGALDLVAMRRSTYTLENV